MVIKWRRCSGPFTEKCKGCPHKGLHQQDDIFHGCDQSRTHGGTPIAPIWKDIEKIMPLHDVYCKVCEVADPPEPPNIYEILE